MPTPLEYALKLLGQRRYTCKGLRDKLSSKGTDEKEIDRVFQRLKEWKYLDDEEYARSFIRSRLRLSPRGVSLLRLELLQKGISPEIIEKVFHDIEISELELAEMLLQKKSKQLQRLTSEKRRQKAVSYLKNRGFRSDVIYDLVREL